MPKQENEHDVQIRNALGKYGVSERNQRGESFTQFCMDNQMTITNTVFMHHPRCLSTWISPSGLYKNQIDYTRIRTRWRASLTNTRALILITRLLKSSFAIKLKAVHHSKPKRFKKKLQNTSPPTINEVQMTRERRLKPGSNLL